MSSNESPLRKLLNQQKKAEETRAQPSQPATASTTPAPNGAVEPKAGGILGAMRARIGSTPVAPQQSPEPKLEFRQSENPSVGHLSPVVVGNSQSPTFGTDEIGVLKKNLAFLAANLDEKELIGQVVRNTVTQLREHPELAAVIVNDDVDLIVAAARRSMRYVARKKQEGSDKREAKNKNLDKLDRLLKDAGDIEL